MRHACADLCISDDRKEIHSIDIVGSLSIDHEVHSSWHVSLMLYGDAIVSIVCHAFLIARIRATSEKDISVCRLG